MFLILGLCGCSSIDKKKDVEEEQIQREDQASPNAQPAREETPQEGTKKARQAQEKPPVEEKELPQEEDKEWEEEEEGAEEELSGWDEKHKEISQKVLDAASWLDSFFGDERYLTEENRTRLRIRTDFSWLNAEGIKLSVKPKLKLSLPGTENRLQLIISGDPDDELSLDDTFDDAIEEEFEDTDEENVSVGLQYFLRATKKMNIKWEAGLRFGSFSPIVYTGARFRRTIPLNSWAMRITERLRWYSDDGWESKTYLDFERPICERFFFRQTTRGSWYESKVGFYYSLRALLYHILDADRILVYDWSNSFETRPHHQLKEIRLKIRYRQRLYKDWIYVEVAPELRFPEERDYEATPGILFRLEFTFGSTKKKKGSDQPK